MQFLACPNELLLLVSANLARPRDIYALLRTNRRLSQLLQPRLRALALLDKDDMNALLWAAFHGYEGLITTTLAAGFTINMRGRADDYDGKTPLYRAVQSGNLAAVNLLLAHGASPCIRTSTYATPLHEAAAYGNEEMVTLLMQLGANIADTDIHSSTPLHWAAAGKQAGNLRVLLDHGDLAPGCIDLRDLTGNTALHSVLALSTHRHSTPAEAVARLLLTHGADPDVINASGCTPLYLAAEHGLPSLISLLLDYGADPHAAGYSRYTPLHHAAHDGRSAIAALLMDSGASPAYLDQQGRTPLDLAYEFSVWNPGRTATLELLLERSVGIALGDTEKSSILWWAADNGLEAMVKLLLRRGIEEFVERGEGETIMQAAVRRQEKLVARVLREMEAEEGQS